MRLIRTLNGLPDFKNAVLTIGSYDGVHQGHQIILKRLVEKAKEIKGESVLITFDPHPRLVVYPNDDSLKLINSVEEKAALLESYGLDNMVVVPFTKEFMRQSPEDYIEKFLVQHFHPQVIIIGYDHRFGHKRLGNIEYLKQFEQQYSYQVLEISKQEVDDAAISSTRIRKQLLEGEVSNASELLSHPFTLRGKVVRGQQIGRKIGYPTANLEVSEPHKLIPRDGIYAVELQHEKKNYQGMLYIGDRPTIEGHSNRTIEVNIFNFDKEIYDEYLMVSFIKKIREDARFDSLEELQAQLAADKISSLEILNP